MKFKVGDRVKCINNGGWRKNLSGKYGTIKVKHADLSCGVEFDEYICGHSCSGHAKNGHGWNCEESMLELAEEKTKPILIYRDGLKVTAQDHNTGKTGVAKCNPSDEFDFYTGAKLALERLTGEEKVKVKFAPDMAIWCENKSQFDELMKILETMGYKWEFGDLPTKYYPPLYANGTRIFLTSENTIFYGFASNKPDGFTYVDFSDVDFSDCVQKIKFGGYVHVTNLGKSYRSFDSFFKAYPDIPVNVAARCMRGSKPEKDKPYEVLYIKKHPQIRK